MYSHTCLKYRRNKIMSDPLPASAEKRLPARLPYPANLRETFPDLDEGRWLLLVNHVWPNARSLSAIAAALALCDQLKLDPVRGYVHLIPYRRSGGGLEERPILSIAGYRELARRTDCYAGLGEVAWGPEYQDPLCPVPVPAWCRVTVYRLVQGQRCPFLGPTVWFREACVLKGDGQLASVWERRPRYMLEKCAEAAALRRAFPDVLGNELAVEELEEEELPPRRVSPEAGGSVPGNGESAPTAASAPQTPQELWERITQRDQYWRQKGLAGYCQQVSLRWSRAGLPPDFADWTAAQLEQARQVARQVDDEFRGQARPVTAEEGNASKVAAEH
jgi:phage recombination protein Bet